jgi:O-antigen/teichoic acid export membrane protein
LFYGEIFTQSYSILSIQIIGLIFVANAGLRSTYLTISGNQRIILVTTVLSAVMNIALNYFLIPILKVYGAALATTITQLCSLFLFNIFFKETRKIMRIQLQTLLLFPFKTSLSERT